MFTAEARSAQRKAGEILHPLSRVQDDDACPMVGNPQRRTTSGLRHVANREIGIPRKGNGLPRRRGSREKQIKAATGLTSWQAGAQQAAPLPVQRQRSRRDAGATKTEEYSSESLSTETNAHRQDCQCYRATLRIF